jgi:hypothetical protein
MATINSYDTKHGVRWEVRYRTPDRRTSRKRAFTSKRKAQDWASTVEVKSSRALTCRHPRAGSQ